VKRIVKSFTFWFIVLAILGILSHQIGQDSKSIVLIGFNPFLNILADNVITREFMNSGLVVTCGTIAEKISIYWYIGSFLTMVLYGCILDLLKCLIIKIRKTRK